jgi:hypothetical protein
MRFFKKLVKDELDLILENSTKLNLQYLDIISKLRVEFSEIKSKFEIEFKNMQESKNKEIEKLKHQIVQNGQKYV